MKQSLQLKLGQHLTMTPQLQQAIRLLQLSSLDLQQEIQQVLESNPLLEAAEEEPAYQEGDEGREREREAEAQGANSELELDRADALPEDLSVDASWDDFYEGGASYSGTGEEGREFEQGDTSESLRDYLLWQMELTPFTERDQQIAVALIDAVNDDGYLGVSLEEIRDSLDGGEEEIELDEIEAVLHRIQAFDPPGIAARDLRECLQLQLRQYDPQTPWLAQAQELVAEHLDLLGSRDYAQLMRRMKLKEDELREVVALIQSVNPRPGGQIESGRTEYIVPDVFVRKVKGAWRVELNPECSPRLRINALYANAIQRANSSEDSTFLKNQLQEARWFIKSLKSRNETLLKVATAIIERQRAFLEYGEEAMKPLVLHDVAEAVGMHESTISRVTNKKYMHTPRGIVELKYFFSSHVGTVGGGECSSTAIRALIKKLISEENTAKPLSDSKLAQILAKQGIQVARRTVAKYRESISIPPSNERKRLS